jgi:hypothetical protein
MRGWSLRRWGAAIGGSVLVALAIGLPTEMIPNPVFHRMLPTEWWNRPAWLVTSLLAGLLLATYVREPDDAAPATTSRRGGLGGFLAFFAVGCPICNKLIVAAIGTSGALNWFAPAQPVLAVTAIVLLAVSLRSRLRSARACAFDARVAGRAEGAGLGRAEGPAAG